MMKIIKIGFVLSALSLFLLSCKTTAQTTAIKSITFMHTFGRGRSTSLTATPEHLETVARGCRTQEFHNVNKKISKEDWNKLVNGLDIKLLDQTQSGERRGHYVGSDQIFHILTAEKEYEFYNVPAESAGYKQLEKKKKKLNNLLPQAK